MPYTPPGVMPTTAKIGPMTTSTGCGVATALTYCGEPGAEGRWPT
jgi:hypothetical protein